MKLQRGFAAAWVRRLDRLKPVPKHVTKLVCSKKASKY
jgi:hypothetical protein